MFSRLTLRTILRIDAVLTGATGALMLGGAWLLDDLLGLDVNLLWVAGVVCIASVTGLLGISRQVPISMALAELVAGINVLWAVGCLAIVFADWTEINALGIGFLLLQVLIVGLLAVLQVNAIRSGSATAMTQTSSR